MSAAKLKITPALSAWICEHQWLETELINHYHYLHQHPEVGSDLPITRNYVYQELCSYGYQPVLMAAGGITALIGNPEGQTLLLRADMDALPIKEETNLSFKSLNGNMHACGHDMHTSMMLGVARLLKKYESELKGCIKIMFQPHEEGLIGACKMIEEGVLENPKVDAALALHVEAGVDPCGIIRYHECETTSSSTIFEITVKGKSAHGAQPHNGIDPINSAARIYLAFQELISRELPATSANILTVGMFQAGNTHNIIPEQAILRCSLRTFKDEEHTFIMHRIHEICQGIGQAFRTNITIEQLTSAPSVYNDPYMLKEVIDSAAIMFGDTLLCRPLPLPVSEDFSHISQLVPSCFITLATGNSDEGYLYPQHNPKVTFDERALIHGCGFMFHSTINWLNHHYNK